MTTIEQRVLDEMAAETKAKAAAMESQKRIAELPPDQRAEFERRLWEKKVFPFLLPGSALTTIGVSLLMIGWALPWLWIGWWWPSVLIVAGSVLAMIMGLAALLDIKSAARARGVNL